jgi:hypothetical protein
VEVSSKEISEWRDATFLATNFAPHIGATLAQLKGFYPRVILARLAKHNLRQSPSPRFWAACFAHLAGDFKLFQLLVDCENAAAAACLLEKEAKTLESAYNHLWASLEAKIAKARTKWQEKREEANAIQKVLLSPTLFDSLPGAGAGLQSALKRYRKKLKKSLPWHQRFLLKCRRHTHI